MRIRERCLPPGWFPATEGAVSRFLEPFDAEGGAAAGYAAVVAPHAGWYYSGAVAAKAVASLARGEDTVAIIGGHLPAGMPILFAAEDAAASPFGPVPLDTELCGAFAGACEAAGLRTGEDRYRDNTVEVLVPMARYFFPGAKLLWLRFPAAAPSFDAGKLLARAAADLGRALAVIASTDLTHYGPNYDFVPAGTGERALEWARKNDGRFIEAVLAGDTAEVLRRAGTEFSACSAGAVLGALGFAAGKGLSRRELLARASSADMREPGEAVPDSFVGYAAMGIGG